MVKKNSTNVSAKAEKPNLFYVFGKASEISFNLVFFPIILLFFGLFLDKKLNTAPIFIVAGCLAGLFFAVYKAIKIKDQIYKK